jgi:MoaA/NifB/PqqE/SkfB family radical SAM enzyme/ubiquinone/menaquinone biosynthesis C-methylase UbiE
MRGEEFFRKIAVKPPFTKMHPAVGAFFKDYLAHEKAVPFRDAFVVNTHFPPYPGPAFDNFAEHFARFGGLATKRLYSVTLAATNRCGYNCWHCYNAGRSQTDIPLDAMRRLASDLQELGACVVTLTGGEPLLRKDLEEIVGFFDSRSCLILGSTGAGLTPKRAKAFHERGLFAVGISLDSADEAEHDRLRGKKGAFRAALQALRVAAENGLYPYIVSIATREFLQRDRFMSFLEFARACGALEVHLLEPCAIGRLAEHKEAVLSKAEQKLIFKYQNEIAERDDLPILSSFAYLESPDAFGCGAGLTHLYIDGSGEVCPCNLVPLSFGNITREPLIRILDRMEQYFPQPRTTCAGRAVSRHVPDKGLPTPPDISAEICEKHLPRQSALPRFFRATAEAGEEVGREELKAAYDSVHNVYDEFWLVEAAKPIDNLAARLKLRGREKILEAGCGTGYATALLARRLKPPGEITAVDLSAGMLAQARRRLRKTGFANVRFVEADALEILKDSGPFDLIFSSWVLGYIPLKPFFAAASRALGKNGRLAFIVHKENSPREPLEIFESLVAENPSILKKRVAFDFPRGLDQVREEMKAAQLTTEDLREGSVVFRYDTAEQVMEHLLKSGAGTAFYEAVDPAKREPMQRRFIELLAERHGRKEGFEVIHDYVACIARKP